MRTILRPAVRYATLGLIATLSLSACTVAPPSGPTLLATPGKGKSYDQFRYDDYRCRQYASSGNNGVTPGQAATNSGVGSALAGTAIGAAAGALLGAATGSPGVGAAFGAGGGLLFGSAVGTGNAEESGASLQASYDRTYAQCMIGSGQDVGIPQPVVTTVYPAPPPVVVVAPPPYPYGYGYGYRRGWGGGW